jgi:ADP-ribose pyrophosphatase
MHDNPRWRRHHSRLLLDRPPWLRVFADEVELPDGRRVAEYLRVEAREYAIVFAVTTDQHVVCLRQYKYGPDAVVLGLPAGYREDGETPEACARRELIEETGYAAATWMPLGSFVPDGNRGFGRAHLFLARDATLPQPPASGDLEAMTVECLPLPLVATQLRAGALVGLPAVACSALALLHLNAPTT